MFDDIEGLLFTVALLVLAGPVLAIIALVRASGLAHRLSEAEKTILSLQARPVATAPTAAPPVVEPATQAPVASEPVLPEALAPEPLEPELSPAEPEIEAPIEQPAPIPVSGNLEQTFAQRWLVWLGAGTLGLGGIFMAAYAVEAGFLGPIPRMALATLLGVVLIGLAFYTRKGELERRGILDLVPAALATGGLATLFGATVASHMLYGLLAAGSALGLMAGVSVAAVLLSLLFGPLTAILGCLGAYAAPFLVAAEPSSLLGVSLYLAVVAFTMQMLSRWTGWRWLSIENAILAISTTAALLILAGWITADSGALALVPTALSIALLAAPLALHDREGQGSHQLGRIGQIILGCALLLSVIILVAGDYANLPMACLALIVVLSLAAAWIERAEPAVAGIAAAAALLATLAYQIPPVLLSPDGIDPPIIFDASLWLVPAAGDMAIALTLIGALFALAGFTASRRQPGNSLFWAGLAVTVPLLALVVACWRLEGFGPSRILTLSALGLAALALVAAKATPTDREAKAAWIAGGFAALALGAAFILRDGWLLISLAALLPILGYVAARTDVPALRRPAMALTVAVLAVAAWLMETELYGWRGYFWAFYSLGTPLLLVLLARRLFAAVRIDLLIELLDAAAVMLWILFVTYATRTLIGAPGMGLGLAEGGVQVCVWLASALALLRLAGATEGRHVLAVAWRLKLALAAVEFVAVCLIDQNPVLTGELVTGWPILNVLALAYLLPALLTAGVAQQLRKHGHARAAILAGVSAILIMLLWIALEAKRSVAGPDLSDYWGQGDQLALSLGWLAFAAVLLLLGIARQDRQIRAGALAVACLAIVKAFIFDLSELEGLYRAASFVGLGLALIGIGWLYGRFVTALPVRPAAQGDTTP